MVEVELMELTELINRSKVNDIHAYNMAVIEEMLRIGGSLKVCKKEAGYWQGQNVCTHRQTG